MTPNVLLLETLTPEAEALLSQHTHVLRAEAPDKGLALTNGQPIQAIVTRGKGKVDAALLAACQDLRLIARAGVGLDNVDVKTATALGARVLNAPGSNASTIAEHTLAMMLMVYRNIYQSVAEVKAGNWAYRTQMQSDELHGKKLGILGLGNIGLRVAKLAKAFGMEVAYWDKYVDNDIYKRLEFHELLTQSNLITLHLPLLPDTQGLLAEEAFMHIQPGTVLINTARGPIIDEEALYKALLAGKLAGYAADVLSVEPPEPDYPLLKLPNVLVTPHSGSLTATTYSEMCKITAQNVVAMLNGDKVDEHYIFNRAALK